MKAKSTFLSLISLIFSLLIVTAQPVESWLSTGPLPVTKPGFINGKNINGEDFEDKLILSNLYLNLPDIKPEEGQSFAWMNTKPGSWERNNISKEDFLEIKHDKKAEYQIAYHAFYVESGGLNEFKVDVESPQMFEVFLDGKRIASSYQVAEPEKTNSKTATLDLDRGKFVVIVKSLYKKDDGNGWKLKTSVKNENESKPGLSISPRCSMNIHHLLEGLKLGSVSLSPDGTMILVNYSRVNTEKGSTKSWVEVKDFASGRVIQSFRKEGTTGFRWVPAGKKLYYTDADETGSSVWVFDFETGKEFPVLESIEDLSGFQWSDDGKFIIYGVSETKKSDDKSSLKYMDDLGNRTFMPKKETYLYKYDVASGVKTRLTFGEQGTSLNDISHDGKYMVFSTSRPNPTERPFSAQNMYLMDLETGEVKTLWEDFGWDGSAEFIPDGKKLLVSGGPDCFGEIGRNIGKNPIANNYDNQLYIYDLATGEVDPITEEFNPSVGSAVWHPADNRIYLTAGDEVYRRAFVWDPETREFNRIITVPEVLGSFSIAGEKLVAVYTGTSLGNHNRVWSIDLTGQASKLFDNPEAETYKNVEFGKSEEWNFVTTNGDEIRGYFLYPLHFDPAKKYPLIVQYYGGTSPVSKSFGGRYPVDIWAGEGYVVYVPQPSGATGFGQEFSARHQNNWGKTVADEIIEGTRKFIESHPFVDKEKVGCIGASYGGFMTMYLQTRTDIFTCAISHAGISSISSYWGEGYWGYAYSSEATGDAYPWDRTDIYIDQSPLFSADKINTPLLLLHGSVDTNVPLGESLQLWVGLKILGKPVEMIQVEGENHHILTYSKRIEWHNAIMAWFDKWLKDTGHDWKKLFPESKL